MKKCLIKINFFQNLKKLRRTSGPNRRRPTEKTVSQRSSPFNRGTPRNRGPGGWPHDGRPRTTRNSNVLLWLDMRGSRRGHAAEVRFFHVSVAVFNF